MFDQLGADRQRADRGSHRDAVVFRTLEFHVRVFAACRIAFCCVRSADHARIEVVMDEHLAALERAWGELPTAP